MEYPLWLRDKNGKGFLVYNAAEEARALPTYRRRAAWLSLPEPEAEPELQRVPIQPPIKKGKR